MAGGREEAMQALQLRRATAADAANVRALARAAYAKWVPLIGREPIPMTADYDRAPQITSSIYGRSVVNCSL